MIILADEDGDNYDPDTQIFYVDYLVKDYVWLSTLNICRNRNYDTVRNIPKNEKRTISEWSDKAIGSVTYDYSKRYVLRNQDSVYYFPSNEILFATVIPG